MAKKCIIERNKNGTIDVEVKNYDNVTALERAVKLNKGYPMDTASNGEPSLLYQFYINELNMSPTEAEYVMTNMFSPEFGEWFGRWWEEGNKEVSRVVDINGQPKPVWSGLLEDVDLYEGYDNVFNKDGALRFNRSGLFVESRETAEKFSTGNVSMTKEQAKKYGIEYRDGIPVFLNLRKIKEVETNGWNIIPMIEEANTEGYDAFYGNSQKVIGEKVYAVRNDSQVLTIADKREMANIPIYKTQKDNVDENAIIDNRIKEEILPEGGTSFKDFMNKQVPNSENYKIAKELQQIYVFDGVESLEDLETKWKASVNKDRYSEWNDLMTEFNITRYNPGIENIYFQNESQNNLEPVPQEVLEEITYVLTQKGLVSKVNLMTPQELRQVLEEMGLSEETMKQVEAWHGSPHLFDKFSTSAMGTGEGVQAFGWGLYFTDLKGIAENYAIKLSRKNRPTLGGTIYEGAFTNADLATTSDDIISSIKETLEYIQDYDVEDYSNRDFESLKIKGVEALRDMRKLSENNITKKYITDFLHILETADSENIPQLLQQVERDYYRTLREEADKILKNPEKYIENYKSSRNLYNVSLHEGKTPEQYTWLEWDKPLTEEHFEKMIIRDYMFNGESGIYGDILDYYTNGFSADYNNKISSPLELIEFLKEEGITGEKIYNIIKLNSSPKEASLKLLSAGIDGVKYPAESLSRGATSDNARGFNYVVFDENAVMINEVVQFQNSTNNVSQSIKPGVSEIFEENPELASIGTQEQYSQYLDTIFPDSKVKDIVYHGTTKGKFDKFITEGSSDNIGKLGAMAGSIEAANLQRGKQDRPAWVRPEEWVEPELPKGSHLYSLLFSLKNPYIAESLDDAMTLSRNDLKEKGHDGVIIRGFENDRGRLIETGFGDEYVAFESEQIHILGSKQDVEGFKNWKDNQVNLQNELDKVGLKLVPNGFYRPSTREIYLNSENPNILETTIHEFAHPFLQYLRDNKPAHYRAGVKLLQSNQEEAQSYIDFVKQTQPNLKEGTQAFYEEVLAQIVGDNGAKLVNSAKKNSIKEWLQNLWETISRFVGITEYTPDEISRMTLEEFSNSVVAEMMDRQGILNSGITLSVLEQPLFTGMRGRSVSPQTISNAMKGKGIKQIERDIVMSVLELPEFQGKKFNYDNFELAVKAQIMPLEKIETDEYADYGSSEIDGRYDSTKTYIFNSPLDHGKTGHFYSDYSRSTPSLPNVNMDNIEIRENIGYDDNPSGGIIYSVEEKNRQHGSLILHSSFTKPDPEELIQIIEEENKKRKKEAAKPKNEGLFGHTRVWTKDAIYNVAEIQSDVFQKDFTLPVDMNKVRSILEELDIETDEKYKPVLEDFLGIKITDVESAYLNVGQKVDKISEGLDKQIYRFEILRDETRNNADFERYDREIETLNIEKKNIREKTYGEFYQITTQIQKEKLENEKKARELGRTMNDKQFLASEKSFELRLIRESIQDAANKGFKKLRLPLPYTLSKIEGYLSEGGQVEIEGEPEIGEYVNYLGGSYRVVDYEGDDVKIISEGDVDDSDKDKYIEDWAYNEIENILYDHFQDENTHSLDEIKSKLDQTSLKNKTKFDIIQMLKEESEQTDEIDLTEYRDQMEEIFVDNVSNWDIEEYLSDLGYYTIIFTKDRILYSTEEGEWVSYVDGSQDKESFSIDDLSENHQPIARRYEAFGEMMKKERPSNFRIVEDENGYPWYETDILDQDKRNPVLAFQKPINISQRDFIPSQLFEELSQQPFLNQEQALDIYQSIYTDDLNHWKDADLNC